MPQFLFAYGTLQNPDIQQKIVGRKLSGKHDILNNHTTEKIILDGCAYPILIDACDKYVEGIVFDILSADFATLDDYEGAEYERVRVILASGLEVWVYKKNNGITDI